ncbi:hypothetical protein VHEMI06134 [[Torrubiella] hemipterigena]|uniref:Uncharacterized protein n=1 Tax=[Torrubiella] hemipterigena TaxID=1531966 RepID=A0A0A1TIQ0_9HYPO|nr:hypothetical protein VHEMI06134 [[Torrubiella] hemipterigena]
MALKSILTMLIAATASNAFSVDHLLTGRSLTEDIAAPSSIVFYNNCTHNIEMWKQGGSTKAFNIAPQSEYFFRLEHGDLDTPSTTYQFAPRGASEEAGRLHVTYMYIRNGTIAYGAAKLHSVLGDPFNNTGLSLGMTSSCGSGPGGAAAAGAGLWVAAGTGCQEIGAASFALGAGFCVHNGNKFDGDNNRAAAAAAAAANTGGSAVAFAGGAAPGAGNIMEDKSGLPFEQDLRSLL